MIYPPRNEYQTAMLNPKAVLADPALKVGQVVRDKLGFPLVASGNFSTVFRMQAGGKTWALRCFIADIGDAAAIYAAIDKHLRRIQSPYFVGFEFQNGGIWIGQKRFPIVKMEWAPGESLKGFLNKNLGKPAAIAGLAEAWRRMVASLGRDRVAHGDLQHDNLLICDGGAGPDIKLIDYDTVVVPEVVGWPENNAGLPAYQHPGRKRMTAKDAEVDNFSALAICASLLALAKKPKLWADFDVAISEGLLFEPGDFEAPDRSRAFGELRALGGECAALAAALRDACQRPDPKGVPRLEDVLGQPTSGPAGQRAPGMSTWWKAGVTGTPPAVAPVTPSATTPPVSPTLASASGGSSWWQAGAKAATGPATSPFTPVGTTPAAQTPLPAAATPPPLTMAPQTLVAAQPPSPMVALPPPPVVASPPSVVVTRAPPTARRSSGGLSRATVLTLFVLVLAGGIALGLALGALRHGSNDFGAAADPGRRAPAARGRAPSSSEGRPLLR